MQTSFDRRDLEAIKQRYGPATTKAAWKTLAEGDRERIKAIAETVRLSPVDAPIASPPKQSLFRIADNLAQLEADFDAFEGEPPEASEFLTALEGYLDASASIQELSEQVDNYCSLIAARRAQAGARAAEAKRLQALAERDCYLAERLTARLQEVLEVRGQKMKTLRYEVAIAQNGGLLPLVLSEDADLRDLPKRFVRRQIRYELNREAIREALDRAEKLTFVRYGPRGSHIRIK